MPFASKRVQVQSRPPAAAPVTAGVPAGDPRAPAPATAAAAAGVGYGRRSAGPQPAATAARPGRRGDLGADVPAAGAPAARATPPLPRRPPAPARTSSRALAGAAQPARAGGVSPLQGGRSVYAAKRSPGRRAALIVGALVLVGAVAALAIALFGGSSPAKAPSASVGTTATTRSTATHPAEEAAQGGARRAGRKSRGKSTSVLRVTNGGPRPADRHNCSRAVTRRPPRCSASLHGTGQVSVVECRGGHRAEAEAGRRTRCR